MRASIGLFTLCRAVAGLSAQDTVPAAATNVKDPVYICPMDPNMRSNTTDKRPKCVMAMVAGIGDCAEFHVHLSVSPSPVKPGTRKRIAFEILDPLKDLPVSKFQVIHERFFHAFLISDDLIDLVHQHPFSADGEPDIQFNMVCTSAYVSRVGAVSAQRCGEHRALRYSGKAAGVTVPEMWCFLFQTVGVERGTIRPPRNVQTTGS